MNNIVLAGNVVKDPDFKETSPGKLLTKLRIAVNNPLNDAETLFIDVNTWDKQADFARKYVKKGSAISVVGRLKTKDWEKDGIKRTDYFVVASEINFNGPKKSATTSTVVAPATVTKATATATATTPAPIVKPTKAITVNESEPDSNEEFDSLFEESRDQF